MMRLLSTLSLAAAFATASVAPMAAQTTAKPAAPAGAAKPAAPAKPPAQEGPAKPAAPAAAKAKPGAGRTIELTGGDDMKFNETAIQAKPGETLHIVLKNVGKVPKIAMAHNFVALKAGVDPAKFSQDAMTAKDTDYVPAAAKADILASTKLAGPDETVETTFKVPAKPGVYPYLCTFPGHFAAGMKGEITAK
jgi:azurin